MATAMVTAASLAPKLEIRDLVPERTMDESPPWGLVRASLRDVIEEYRHAIAKLSSLTSALPSRLYIDGIYEDSFEEEPQASRLHSSANAVSGRQNGLASDKNAALERNVPFSLDHASHRTEPTSPRSLDTPSRSKSFFSVAGSADELYLRTFHIKPNWQLKDRRAIDDHIKAANGSAERDKDFMRSQTFGVSQGVLVPVHGWTKLVMASPDRHFRVGWELFGIVLAMYDMIWVPLILAFSPEEGGFRNACDWIGRLFWTLNVPVTLTTGFVSDGKLILELSQISKRYLKTWFIVDLLTIPPDWLFLIISGGSASGFIKILRSLRTLRLFRLFRLVKLRNAWNYIFDSIDSEQVGIFLEVVKMVLVLMLVNHYNACLWCLVGKADPGKNWIARYKYRQPEDADWPVQYIVAYHWSITQFTPSSMHVQPQNPGERVFAIFVVIFGLVGFSYLVGSITSSLGRLRAISELKTTSFWHLRKFMLKNRVPYHLSTRIKSYVENRWADQHNNMRLANMEFMLLLSDNLKGELALELHGPTLRIHPLLQHLSESCANTIQRVAIHGVAQLSLAPQDVMFHAGEEASHMSLVASGSMHYTRVHNEKSYPEPVNSNEDWIAEPVLWVGDWRHLGDLRSTETTELLMVSSEKLHESASANPLALWTVHHYARKYTQWLNSIDPSRLSDITQGEQCTSELYSFVRHFDYSGEPGVDNRFSENHTNSSRNASSHSMKSTALTVEEQKDSKEIKKIRDKATDKKTYVDKEGRIARI